MDFQFHNLYGKVFCQCSMGYEALASWVNIEFPLSKNLIQDVQFALEKNENRTFIGREYSLFLKEEEAIIQANGLDVDEQLATEIDENLHLYYDDAFCACGREDFAHFFNAYLDFME